MTEEEYADGAIAIVGMACRFPGAGDVEEFWGNLVAGADTITRFTADDIDPHPDHVPARGVLPGGDRFDWTEFRFGAGEAARLDPQHRVFLETALTALDDAGVDPRRSEAWVGVFAGCDVPRADFDRQGGPGGVVMGHDKDYLATRAAYKLGLRGPAMTVQTACSTSLVAVHLAAQSLLGHECDAALAGAVTLRLPQTGGYRYEEGGILSRDGRCRSFDADADGTVPSAGAGVVVLKRLADAMEDGDRVIAVIRGSAVNNDGAEKVGFTAPSVAGQRDVISLALSQAGLSGSDIGYVEAHGTATRVGDPVELAGLTAAFAESGGDRTGPCWIGSVKSNIGHTGPAAGVAGLIKTALMLQRRTLVPNANFRTPAPALAGTPFQVCAEHRPWEGPFAAGVSSFGVGGTNAHVVLEGPPPRPRRTPETETGRLLCLSAPTAGGLARLRERLAERLRADPETRLDDVAWSLATGRRRFAHRVTHVVTGRDEAMAALTGPAPATEASAGPRVILALPGQLVLRAGAGRAAHALLPEFRRVFDRIREETADRFGVDLSTTLDPGADPAWALDTRNQQLALFACGYALGAQLAAWNVRPAAIIGHSVGEYAGAALAGVWDVSGALAIVHARGTAMREAPRGRMLSVRMTAAEAAGFTGEETGIGLAVDAPRHVVLGGSVADMAVLEDRLRRRRTPYRGLDTEIAFHTPAMRDAAAALRAAVAGVPAHRPVTPLISNVTGSWSEPERLADPDYWAAHLCGTVRLTDGIGTVLAGGTATVCLELGPGDTLTRSVRAHPAWDAAWRAVPVLGRSPEREHESVLAAVGRLWESGAEPGLADLFADTPPRRTALPPAPLDSRPCVRPAPPRPASPGPASGPLLTSPRWGEIAADGRRDATYLLIGDANDETRSLVTSAYEGAEARPPAGWTPPEITAALTGLDVQGVHAVGVLPAPGDPAMWAALDRLAGAPAPLVLIGTGLADVMGDDATRTDAAELTAWAAHRTRTRSPGTLTLLDLGTGEPPARLPRPRPDASLFAWRGGRWWSLAHEPVPPPHSEGAAPGGLAVICDGVPYAARLAGDLAAVGVRVGAFAETRPVRRPPLAVTAADPDDGERLSRDPLLQARLTRFCAGLAGRFVLDAARVGPGDHLPDDELRRRVDPGARLPRLVGVMLRAMSEEGWLSRTGDGWRVGEDAPARVAEALRDGRGTGGVEGLRRLVEHCAGAYPAVFAGERTPVSVLYPDGDAGFLHECLRDNRLPIGDAEPCLDLLAGAIRSLDVGPDRPLRVLEVGAGQAEFAWRLLAEWEASEHVSYHVTDVSPLLVRRARDRYRERPAGGMRFSTFDMTRDPVEQGLARGTFDLVLGYNSVHVAADVRPVLRELRGLLTATGSLCLVELTRTNLWTQLIWGLAPGWWDFDDDLRTDSVHLEAETWERLLRETGLSRVTTVRPHAGSDEALLVATAEPPEGCEADRLPRELARQGDDFDGVLHIAGPHAETVTPVRLGDRPTLVVTPDPPEDADRHAELRRRRADPGERGPDPEWRHVEVPRLGVAELAAACSLTVRPGLPAVTRLESVPALPAEPATEAAEPAPAPSRATASSGPADPLLTGLAEVWCDLLGVPEAAGTDGFFALGGDSLTAVHFVSRVRDRTGVSLPLTAFAESATFGALAALMTAARGSAEVTDPAAIPDLMVLRHSTAGIPLVLAAPAVGSSLCYRGLASRLPADQACYGIESPLLRDGFRRPARVEDVAAHHIEVLREVRPHGPYRLGGWSHGAIVAHEMARLLTEAGDAVDLVIGIDGHVLDTGGRPLGALPGLLAQGLRYHLQATLGRRPDIQEMGGDPARFRRAFQHNVRSMLRYTPRPVPCGALVLRAGADRELTERLHGRIAPLYGGDVRVEPAPGTHFSLLRAPGVDGLAAQITAVLAERDGPAGERPATPPSA